MMSSWYSHESRSSTKSPTLGWPERNMDSELPAQSWNSSQTRTGLVVLSSALTTACT